MAPSTDEAHAFMPSPNDTLSLTNSNTANGNHTSRVTHPTFSFNNDESSRIAALQQEHTVLSPSSPAHGSDLSPNTVMSPDISRLPTREFVPTASSLPGPHPPTDSTFWHDQYNKTIKLHDQEREIWNQVREHLERTVVKLREELSRKNANSGVSFFPGKENDKVYANSDIIRQSQEKLRQLSNASSSLDQPSSSGNSGSITRIVSDQPSTETYGARRHSSNTTFPPSAMAGQRLSSISERDDGFPTPGKRVSISAEAIEEIIGEADSDGELASSDAFLLNREVNAIAEEDPPSPQQTARAITPPNMRIHAGHTPVVPRAMSPRNEFDGASEEVAGASLFSKIEGDADTDPELNSPKALPSVPFDGSDIPELDDLTKKLETVASDPLQAVPEAVRGQSEAENEDEENDVTQNGAGEQFKGVKLKTQRSLNFGAPLGDLGKRG